MSMGITGSRGARSAINVTPLVNVLLVLLIIFMIIEPVAQRGIDATASKTHDAQADSRTVVISVSGTSDAPTYAINGQATTLAELGPGLKDIVQRSGQYTLLSVALPMWTTLL